MAMAAGAGGDNGALDVFIEFEREPTDVEAAVLRDNGVPSPPSGRASAVVTARLTPAAIEAVAALDAVLRLTAAARLKPYPPR